MIVLSYILLFVLMGTLSALAGDSFPIKSVNEFLNKKLGKTLGGKLPEILIAVIIGSVGTYCWSVVLQHVLNIHINGLWYVPMWAALTGIAYAGKESGTHGYLQHEGAKKDKNGDGKVDNDDLRDGTMSPWNIWLASRFGFKYGDEGFSWAWAFTKGFMTTFPVFCLGMIFQPLFREAASHAEGRLPGDANFYMELGDGFAYAASIISAVGLVTIFILGT